MKIFQYLILSSSLWFYSLSLLGDPTSEKPNILLITADDLGWNSLGCMGNKLKGLSPNLDRLASEGLLIKHGYVATPICGPSRQALYTGQFPQSNGFMGHGIQPPKWWKSTRTNAGTQSITSQLLDHGYLSGMIGKHGSQWCRFSLPPHGENQQTGMGRNPEKYFAFTRKFLAQAKEEKKPFFLAANAHDPHRYWARHPDETSHWINQMMGDGKWKPFPNGKPYPDPKSRFTPEQCPIPSPYPSESKIQETIATYYDSVNRMDQVVGEIIQALQESGLADNTLVIFLSDHGMAWDLSKWSLYPSGVRTPIIIRWPARVKSGQIDSQSVVSVVDIAPTIAELCGLPPLKKTDGQSFSSLLTDRPLKWQRTTAFSCFNYMNNHAEVDDSVPFLHSDLSKQFDQYRPSRALNTSKFCYIWNGWSDGVSTLPPTMLGEFHSLLPTLAKNPLDIVYGDYLQKRDFIKYRTNEELYELSTDPGCHNNLANEAQYKEKLIELQNTMKNILEKTNDHELKSFLAYIQKSKLHAK